MKHLDDEDVRPPEGPAKPEKSFKPMLAGTVEDVTKLKFPLIASPKIDGIRAIARDGKLFSRSLKPIPNKHICKVLGPITMVVDMVLDGELLVGKNFQDCSSGVMSIEGEPDFQFWCFDLVYEGFDMPYSKRVETLAEVTALLNDPRIVSVPTKVINNLEELNAYEAEALELGFEGVMLRTPEGPYKWGRSTWKEGYLLKLKRFEDAEAKIVGFEEQMHNANEATTNELGRTKRSSAKDGLVPKGTLGALQVVGAGGAFDGVAFNIGSGFDDMTRAGVWANRDSYFGKLVRFKYQPHGAKDAPRIPIFMGFRAVEDTGGEL